MTTALLFDDRAPVARFTREDLRAGRPEHWLRDLVFGAPGLLPLEQIDPAQRGAMIPVCTEFPLRTAGRHVFLDILGVTARGRLVLVECKLWRNPQARREVVAQVLEYAALLRRLSYADLTAILRARLGSDAANPLHDLVAGRDDALDEAAFVDAVARGLDRGDFDLIVAGDGIREDAASLAEHLHDTGARLALVELQAWRDAADRLLILPQVPFRSEVIRQRVLVDGADRPLRLEDVAEAAGVPEGAGRADGSGRRAANRAFWEAFASAARFDHPDQPPPRHGGDNWVKIPLPFPGRWITAYRTGAEIGFFVAADPAGAADALLDDAAALRAEIDPALRFPAGDRAGAPLLAISAALAEVGDAAAQLDWLQVRANRMVNALRPRLARLGEGRRPD